MGSTAFNLNEPPSEDGSVRYVMLQKDRKTICRTQCRKLPFEVPALWTVSDFRPGMEYLQSDMPRCLLYPEPENNHQKKEWGLFLQYLQKRNEAAVVKSESCEFYILAPHEGPEYTHAVVPYQMQRTHLKSDDRKVGKSAMKDDVLQKNFVRTDPSYLHTLSQSHSGWIFGAIAELVDNSKDAQATRLDIFIECLYSKKARKKIPVLSVIDDGHGMSHLEIVRMLSFGHKQPDGDDQEHIGRFGIGFKTGAMKLGRDAIVLTQTSSSRSVAFLSQSLNENKENLEIPTITYRRQGHYMEVDLNVQSEASANCHLNAIKEFSPFNEYFIGEKFGLFSETGNGTQIYIWNLDRWGSEYSLEWDTGKTTDSSSHESQGDILIRSKRLRSRPGQISREVPLDYSLQAYLEVIFLDPRIKIYVQGSLVKGRPLAKSLNKTCIMKGQVMGREIQLTLGRSQVEWERMNCGMFLYWHGRLIEAYKRVGGMIYNADMGRGVLGVADVTNIMDDGNGHVWVLNNKQGFQDCEAYAKLEAWLGQISDEYWDTHFDAINLKKGNAQYKPDHAWVQCDKCRKWRILSSGFDSDSLPPEWFCYMPPFNGKCETPEHQIGRGVITVNARRSGYDSEPQVCQGEEAAQTVKSSSERKNQRFEEPGCSSQQKFVLFDDPVQMGKNTSAMKHDITKQSWGSTPPRPSQPREAAIRTKDNYEGDSDSTQTEDESSKPIFKRLRRGPARSCKQS